ncbi:YggT family protein [Candidatus Saccharibacteria bacterium]|nr:MAG: YggT family protein [Candidatus Saccharibacteria bacterium]
MNILARIVNFIGSLIVALLAIRFVLVIVGANAANGFVDFIYSASYPLVAPFFGIFNYQQDFGVAHIEWSTLLAIVVYAIATALLTGLLSSSSHRHDTV